MQSTKLLHQKHIMHTKSKGFSNWKLTKTRLLIMKNLLHMWLFSWKRKLKRVAFIVVEKNPADQNFYIRFSIENWIVNISFYELSWLKLNFGCYLTFENIF